MNKKGQIILALVLVMTVALAIGLSIIQKSLIDVSTSTKVEQSSRAFSAAEAGIERALQQAGITNIAFPENDSAATVTDTGSIPCIPGSVGCAQGTGTQQAALEYPPLSKEEIAQVWLADYISTTGSAPPNCGPNIKCHYIQNSLDVFWGNNSTDDKAALELTLVYYDGSKYTSKKWYLDHQSASRNPANNFETVPCSGTGLSGYQCTKRLNFSAQEAKGLILIRARLLYNSSSQPFAVQAIGTCGVDCLIPPQARILDSRGTSGETQRKVRVFQLNKVVPHWFDYAIFSAGEIKK